MLPSKLARAVVQPFACSALSGPRRSIPSCWRRSSPWGIPRALIAKVNFETSEIAPVASLNFSKALLQRFHTSLFCHGKSRWRASCIRWSPNSFPAAANAASDLYYHPLIYRNRTACWEAERSRAGKCVAVENYHSRLKLQLQEQVCSICNMRAYAAMAVVEVKRGAQRATSPSCAH